MTQISLKLFYKLAFTRNEIRTLSRAESASTSFYPRGRGGGLAEGGQNPKTKGIAGDRSPEDEGTRPGSASSKVYVMGISNDFSKAFPIVLGPRSPASLPFFLADHCRVVGVRCQN